MEEYVSKNFEDHPAFASVITRFVTNNKIQSNVSDLSTRVDKLEFGLKNLKGRVDNIFNRLDKLDKKVFGD